MQCKQFQPSGIWEDCRFERTNRHLVGLADIDIAFPLDDTLRRSATKSRASTEKVAKNSDSSIRNARPSYGIARGVRGLDAPKQVGKIPRPVVAPAVDEERWRTRNAAANAT